MEELIRESKVIKGNIECPYCKNVYEFFENGDNKAILKSVTNNHFLDHIETVLYFDLLSKCKSCGFTTMTQGVLNLTNDK